MTLLIETEIPDWVTHIAQDEDGAWRGYEKKPAPNVAKSTRLICGVWSTPDGGRHCRIGDSGEPNPNWRDTLHEIVVKP